MKGFAKEEPVKRAECIAMLYPELDDKAVVTIMGACAQELYDLGHRENFFYLQHAMGLASSIGLGLALHLPREKVVVLDGDGSVLMNLGTLATLARYRPTNLVHVIFDNGSLLSTGGFDSHTTSGITDLAAIARGAGHRARRRSRFGGRIRRGGDRRVRAKRPQRDRRQGRGRRARITTAWICIFRKTPFASSDGLPDGHRRGRSHEHRT